MGQTDTLTVLSTFGTPATKVFSRRRDGTIRKTSYGSGARFWSTEVIGVRDIRDLARALKTLEGARQSFVVRGARAPDADPDNMARLVHAREDQPATLVDVPRHWLMIDMDGIPRGDGPDPALDPQSAAESMIRRLPDAFHRATCWWQWSSSQGMGGDDALSVHLWFWLAEPQGSADLRRWASAVNTGAGRRLVDPALFNAAQPHYTAAPLFKGGVHDPLPRRSGLRVGEVDAVALSIPALPVLSVVESPPPETDPASEGRGIEARLEAIGGPTGFHGPIKSTIGAWFAAAGSEADGEALKARVRERLAEVAPQHPTRAGDLARYASDRFLDDLIAWTRARQFTAEAGPQACPPSFPAPTLTVRQVREALKLLIAGFVVCVIAYHARLAEALAALRAAEAARVARNHAGGVVALPEFGGIDPPDIPAPRLAVPVGVGIGKSRAAREAIAAGLRDGSLTPPVVYSVPTHVLGREQVAAFEALGVTAALWRGRRGQEDGASVETVTCFDMDAVLDAQSVGADAQTAVCKSRAGQCAHFDSCPYQRQKAVVRAADVVIVPHSSLFHRKPATIRAPSMLVIDEGFAETRETAISLDAIQALNEGKESDGPGEGYLVPTRKRLAMALRATEPGRCVSLARLREVGLTAVMAREAHRLEWRRKIEPALVPGMSPAARSAAVEAARGNTSIAPLAAIWRLIAEGLENDHDPAGVTVDWRMGTSGETFLVVRARWRAEIKTGWSDGVPILHMDATLDPEIASLFLPGVEVSEPMEATAPHMRIRQILGAPVTRQKLLPDPKARYREHRTAANHLRDLQAHVRLRAMEWRGRGAAGGPDVLLVAQKEVIQALADMGLPSNVDAAWFNNLAGRDDWRGVGGMIVLGRTLPAARPMEAHAIALTNRPPTAVPDHTWWYDLEDRGIRMSDGTGHAIAAAVHPDPMAERVRWNTCDAELIQAIGRGRGVNRTEADPLEVDLLVSDVVLPLTVDELVVWEDVRPSRADVMWSRGVWLDNAADRARAFPDLWRTHQAARDDRKRSVASGYRDPLIAKRHTNMPPAAVRYRRRGASQKTQSAVFDLSVIPDPQAWLTQRLGPLAEYAVLAPATRIDVG